MKNFEPGGLRNRKPDLGGRPMSDASNYAPKKRFDSKQSFSNKPAFTNDRAKKDMTLYSATCTTCGKSCEVPFRPDGVKPVLCRDCFAAKNESPAGGNAGRDRFAANDRTARPYERPAAQQTTASVDYTKLLKQMTDLDNKLNQILAHLEAPQKPEIVSTVDFVSAEVAKVSTRKPKKVTPAIKKAAAKKKATVAKKVAKKAIKK